MLAKEGNVTLLPRSLPEQCVRVSVIEGTHGNFLSSHISQTGYSYPFHGHLLHSFAATQFDFNFILAGPILEPAFDLCQCFHNDSV